MYTLLGFFLACAGAAWILLGNEAYGIFCGIIGAACIIRGKDDLR